MIISFLSFHTNTSFHSKHRLFQPVPFGPKMDQNRVSPLVLFNLFILSNLSLLIFYSNHFLFFLLVFLIPIPILEELLYDIIVIQYLLYIHYHRIHLLFPLKHSLPDRMAYMVVIFGILLVIILLGMFLQNLL